MLVSSMFTRVLASSNKVLETIESPDVSTSSYCSDAFSCLTGRDLFNF